MPSVKVKAPEKGSGLKKVATDGTKPTRSLLPNGADQGAAKAQTAVGASCTTRISQASSSSVGSSSRTSPTDKRPSLHKSATESSSQHAVVSTNTCSGVARKGSMPGADRKPLGPPACGTSACSGSHEKDASQRRMSAAAAGKLPRLSTGSAKSTSQKTAKLSISGQVAAKQTKTESTRDKNDSASGQRQQPHHSQGSGSVAAALSHRNRLSLPSSTRLSTVKASSKPPSGSVSSSTVKRSLDYRRKLTVDTEASVSTTASSCGSSIHSPTEVPADDVELETSSISSVVDGEQHLAFNVNHSPRDEISQMFEDSLECVDSDVAMQRQKSAELTGEISDGESRVDKDEPTISSASAATDDESNRLALTCDDCSSTVVDDSEVKFDRERLAEETGRRSSVSSSVSMLSIQSDTGYHTPPCDEELSFEDDNGSMIVNSAR
jgi:hypothetical protein